MDKKNNWQNPSDITFTLNEKTHIWRLLLEFKQEKLEYFKSTLSKDEIDRANRFIFDKHRKHFIAARAQLRFIIGKYLNIQAEELNFEYNEFGKPFIKDHPLFFNLSHSHKMALLALNVKSDLGIDIEWKGRQIKYLEIGERFFSKNEFKELKSLPPNLQSEGFFNCWTRKEAYIKGVGKGLGIPLSKFEVSLKPEDKTELRSTRHDPEAVKIWKILALYPNPDYAAALSTHKYIKSYFLWNGDNLLNI